MTHPERSHARRAVTSPWRLLVVAVTLVAALALAACGSSSDDAGGSGGARAATDLTPFERMTPAPGTETVDTAKFASDEDSFTIGFSDVSLVNSWRIQARKTAEIKAKEWGVDLRVTDAGGDAKKQISDIEDLLTQGIDALVVSPVAPKPLAPVLDRAASSGIPVILWSSKADTDEYTASVVADDRYFGETGGRELCKLLGGRGNVIALRGIPGINVETDRFEGAKEAMEGCGLKIIAEEYGQWAFAQGKKAAENLLASHDDIDGVWSSGADMTRGAIQAFQEAKRPLVPMTGEGQNGFLGLWKSDRLRSVAPIYEPWQGAEAVKLAILALQGREIKRDYLLKSPPVTDATLDKAYLPRQSPDFWIDDDYLTQAQIQEIFPKK